MLQQITRFTHESHSFHNLDRLYDKFRYRRKRDNFELEYPTLSPRLWLLNHVPHWFFTRQNYTRRSPAIFSYLMGFQILDVANCQRAAKHFAKTAHTLADADNNRRLRGLASLAVGYSYLLRSNHSPDSDVDNSALALENLLLARTDLLDLPGDEFWLFRCQILLCHALIVNWQEDEAVRYATEAAETTARMWSFTTKLPARKLSIFEKGFCKSNVWKRLCFTCIDDLALNYIHLERYSMAHTQYQHLMDLVRQHYKRPDHPIVLGIHCQLLDTIDVHNPTEAATEWRKLRHLTRNLPNKQDFPVSVEMMSSRLIANLTIAGNFAEARAEVEKLNLTTEVVQGLDHHMLLDDARYVYLMMGDYKKVVELTDSFNEWYVANFGSTDRFVLRALRDKWSSLIFLGKYETAAQLAMAIADMDSKNENVYEGEDYLRGEWDIAYSLFAADRLHEAAYYHCRCLFLLYSFGTPVNLGTMLRNVLKSLAHIYELQGRLTDAADTYDRLQRAYWASDRDTMNQFWYLWYRGKMFMYRSQFQEAMDLFLAAAAVAPPFLYDEESKSSRHSAKLACLVTPRTATKKHEAEIELRRPLFFAMPYRIDEKQEEEEEEQKAAAAAAAAAEIETPETRLPRRQASCEDLRGTAAKHLARRGTFSSILEPVHRVETDLTEITLAPALEMTPESTAAEHGPPSQQVLHSPSTLDFRVTGGDDHDDNNTEAAAAAAAASRSPFMDVIWSAIRGVVAEEIVSDLFLEPVFDEVPYSEILAFNTRFDSYTMTQIEPTPLGVVAGAAGVGGFEEDAPAGGGGAVEATNTATNNNNNNNNNNAVETADVENNDNNEQQPVADEGEEAAVMYEYNVAPYPSIHETGSQSLDELEDDYGGHRNCHNQQNDVDDDYAMGSSNPNSIYHWMRANMEWPLAIQRDEPVPRRMARVPHTSKEYLDQQWEQDWAAFSSGEGRIEAIKASQCYYSLKEARAMFFKDEDDDGGGAGGADTESLAETMTASPIPIDAYGGLKGRRTM